MVTEMLLPVRVKQVNEFTKYKDGNKMDRPFASLVCEQVTTTLVYVNCDLEDVERLGLSGLVGSEVNLPVRQAIREGGEKDGEVKFYLNSRALASKK